MLPRLLILLLCVGFLPPSASLRAQEAFPFSTKQVLVLASEPTYAAAFQKAKAAAGMLHYPLDLRGLAPIKGKPGLSLSAKDCEENGWDYPSYEARGRVEEKMPFVSVEYSNEYPGFRKGYYMVVAAMGDAGSVSLKRALTAAKSPYPSAYLKATKIYMGCEH